MKYAIAVFFASISMLNAVPIFYDKVTNEVKAWGRIDPNQYVSEHPELGFVNVKDDDPMLKNDVKFLTIDSKTGIISLKDQPTIDSIKQADINTANTSLMIALQQKVSSVDALLAGATAQALIDDLNSEKLILKTQIDKLSSAIK